MAGSVLATGALLCAAGLTTALVAVGAAAVTGQRAAGAADAAALAAADTASGFVPGDACSRAAQIAEASGVEIVSCELDGSVATVTIGTRFAGLPVTASARAGPPSGVGACAPTPEPRGAAAASDDRASATATATAATATAAAMTREPDASCAAYPLHGSYTLTSGYGPRPVTIEGASAWHPAYDFVQGGCGAVVFAVRPGTVVLTGGVANALGIRDDATGAVVMYLHMPPGGERVGPGDVVAAGQPIGEVGDTGVGGCHLDVRIRVTHALDERVRALPRSESAGGPAGYVEPGDYMALFGADLCPPARCTKAGAVAAQP